MTTLEKPIERLALCVIAGLLLNANAFAYKGDLTAAGQQFMAKYASVVPSSSQAIPSQESSHTGGLTAKGQQFLKKHSDLSIYTNQTSLLNTSSYSSLSSKTESTVAIKGYGEVNVDALEDAPSYFNVIKIDPIIVANFKDRFLFESQLDLNLDNTGKTYTDVRTAYLDWNINRSFTLEGGKFYSPAGKFVNSFYFPWLNKMPTEPVGFYGDEAAPQEDIGLQGRGLLTLSDSAKIKYSVFVVNAPRAVVEQEEEDEEPLISGINSSGFPSDLNGPKVWGGRIGFFPIPSLEIGASAGAGTIDLFLNGIVRGSSRSYHLWGTDLTFEKNNITLLGEYIQQNISNNVNELNTNPVRLSAWYGQASYKLLPTHWEAVFRAGAYDAPVIQYKETQYAFGLDYWFTPTAVAKFAYAINQGEPGVPFTNANQVLAQFALGFS